MKKLLLQRFRKLFSRVSRLEVLRNHELRQHQKRLELILHALEYRNVDLTKRYTKKLLRST